MPLTAETKLPAIISVGRSMESDSVMRMAPGGLSRLSVGATIRAAR